MLIDNSTVLTLADEALSDMSKASFKTHSHPCPHCGCHVRYPVTARKADLDDFAELMKAAYRAMDRLGITGNLIAELRAQIAVSIAKRQNTK